MNNENLMRNFTHITIPAEIWLRRDISIYAKALWAEIWSLHDREKGGCYASNEYLCEFLNLKISRLKEILKELRDAGLIKDVSFDGRTRVISAVVPEVIYRSGNQASGKPDGSQPENRLSNSRKTGSSPYIYNKEENKEEREEISSPSPAHKVAKKIKKEKPTKVPKTRYRENVELTSEQYNKLMQKYGDAKFEWMLNYLEAKKGANGYTYESDYHVLLPSNWVHKAYEEFLEESKKYPSGSSSTTSDEDELIQQNKKWLKEIISSSVKLDRWEQHTISEKGIVFYNTESSRPDLRKSENIYFKDAKFKDLIIHEMRKRKYERN